MRLTLTLLAILAGYVSMAAFAAGCAAAAIGFKAAGDRCFLLPPVLALAALLRVGAAPPP